VIVDPSPDGRVRLLTAIDQLRDLPVDAVDEAAIAGVLMAPAPIEPDLTVILGPRQHLPPSLVWELAYSEIVYIDTYMERSRRRPRGTCDRRVLAPPSPFRRHRVTRSVA